MTENYSGHLITVGEFSVSSKSIIFLRGEVGGTRWRGGVGVAHPREVKLFHGNQTGFNRVNLQFGWS
jgi:hypothetical protein